MNLFGLSFILYFFKLPYGPDKLHKNFKLAKFHVDEDTYKESRHTVPSRIPEKKMGSFEEKVKANTANPKETLKNGKKS